MENENKFSRILNQNEILDTTSISLTSTRIDAKFKLKINFSFILNLIKFSKCKPELKIIKLPNFKDQIKFYYPNCIRIKQCGGSCYSNIIEFQPNKTEYVNYPIFLMKYNNSKKK